MPGRQISDSETEVEFDLGNSITLVDADSDSAPIEKVRTAVNVTREAVHAISITALETLREGAVFMGVIGSRGELVNPFTHVDAAIWSESSMPQEVIDSAYDYCEELTRREAGNFYHSFKYLPEEERRSIMAYYAFCRRADDIADGDYIDYFPGGSEDNQESIDYRTKIERLIDGRPVLERSSYNDKMSQLFYYRKKLSTAYGKVTSTDPIFIALKDTVNKYGISRQLLDDMISGMEEDFHRNRYETFEDLYSYCYKVASTVGLVCIEIYGYDDKRAREYAESWGIYMQLTNILRDVAEDIDVHESTVSRITTNKYVHTPQGIFELKYFFTSGIDQAKGEAVSSKRIKDMILQMVQKENLKSPYTDLQIADILERKSGIKVARRTVAKYREALNILPSNKRKQLF